MCIQGPQEGQWAKSGIIWSNEASHQTLRVYFGALIGPWDQIGGRYQFLDGLKYLKAPSKSTWAL